VQRNSQSRLRQEFKRRRKLPTLTNVQFRWPAGLLFIFNGVAILSPVSV